MKYPYLIICIFFQLNVFSQKIQPRTYVAHKTNEPIKIDGKATEKSWEEVQWSQDFIDIEGKKTPTYRTRFKMLWDEKNIYFFAKMEEPHVWATLKQRDTVIFYNNDFEIFIDPDGDTHNYYEFEVNAYNTVWDLFLTKPYREKNKVLNGWDINGLKSAVFVNGTLNNASDIDKGWNVEIAIPWKALAEAHNQDNIPRNTFWRINFSRVNWNFDLHNGRYSRKKDKKNKYVSEYNWVWSPQGVINMHEPEKWGYVFFSTQKTNTENKNFTIPDDEKIKWHLYELYRLKKAKKLKDVNYFSVKGKQIKIVFEKHKNGWNIWTKSPFTQKILLVTNTGKFTKS